MMRSTRTLVSGRDFQLRYVLHRVTLLALDLDDLHDLAVAVRLEWPVAVGKKTIDVDAVFEDEQGSIVEIIECREHLSHLSLAKVKSFLATAKELRKKTPRFRYVSNGRFLDDGTDFADPSERKRLIGGVEDSLGVPVIWELGIPDKRSLTAECVFHFRNATNPGAFYSRLYARLAGQMSHRLKREGDVFVHAIKDLHQFLFGDVTRTDVSAERLSADLRIGADEAFYVSELRGELTRHRSPGVRALKTSSGAIRRTLQRGIFGESKVALDDIFIEPDATALVQTATNETSSFTEPALALLFQWAHSAYLREGDDTARLVGFEGARMPLLVLAPFGCGKSSLLTMFAARLIESDTSVVPVLIPLRELKAAGTEQPLLQTLIDYVQGQHGIDLRTSDDEICLLCDGFDELNLFYSGDSRQEWVETGYRQLSSLAQRPNVCVIISSRPILLMDSASVARDGTTRLHLLPFDDEKIERWCRGYASKAGLKSDLSLAFLQERNLVEVARTPIVLYMIARIVETDPQLLEPRRYTRSEIYRLFIDWTERGGYTKDGIKHDLPAQYRAVLQDIAWHLFQSGNGFMREDDLLTKLRAAYGETTPERIPVGRNLLVAHMLTTTTKSMIEFTHQSFREYLVAERIWRSLESARLGDGLTPEVWIALRGRLLTDAKIQLLIEMVQQLSAVEAASLHMALSDTDNIHTYWSKWSRPVWEEIERGEMSGEDARTYFATLAARAVGLAVLSIILKIKAYRKAGADGSTLSAGTLRTLMSFLDSFPDVGTGAAARTLLLTNLSSLRITSYSDLSQTLMNDANLSDGIFHDVVFSKALLTSTTIEESLFRNCRFEGAEITARWWRGVKFHQCNFTGAQLDFNTDDLCEAVEFVDCTFDNASVGKGALGEAVFRGCSWKNARIGKFTMVHASLDRASAAFFRRHRVKLDG